mgnify:CR=1 FL=1
MNQKFQTFEIRNKYCRSIKLHKSIILIIFSKRFIVLLNRYRKLNQGNLMKILQKE